MNGMVEKLLILLVGAGLTYLLTWLGRSRDRKTDKVLNDEKVAIEAVKTRDLQISELQRKVQHLESLADEQRQKAIPIEAAMQAMLIAKLTNEHTPEADALLKKVTDSTLTVEDAKKLAKALKQRTTDETVSEAQQISADLLPGVIRLGELRKLEEESKNACSKTVMVTVPETETVDAEDGGTQEEEKGN